MLATLALTALASWSRTGTERWIAVACGALATAATIGFATAAQRERERLAAALTTARKRLPAEVLLEIDLEPPPIDHTRTAAFESEGPRLLR